MVMSLCKRFTTGRIWLPVVGLCLLAAATVSAEPAYIRHPDLHEETLVFCAEADLWLTDMSGGAPRRLTTHDGNEYFPQFSPDGSQVAFTARYDGNKDVYVVPIGGGEPQRVTWHPGRDELVGWTPDGEQIIFRSNRFDAMRSQHLFAVDLKGGDPQELPLGRASRIAIDEQSGHWAFVRNNRENRPWKRYRGGWASDLWVGDPELADFRKITDFDGMDHFPMWHGGRIWFLSDKGGTSNIWSILPNGSDRKRHTEYDKWDIRWPSQADDGRIVFTLAADVYVYDPETGDTEKVNIDVASDRQLTRIRYPSAASAVSEIALSPEGDRVAVIARGEIFSVPVEEGVTYPVTRGTGARERQVIYHPDGDKLLYVTDEKREEEIRTMDAWGRGEAETITSASKGVWHYQHEYSADGRWIAYADDSYGLFVMEADGDNAEEIDRGTAGEIRTYNWSPGGRWLAYSKELPNQQSSLFVYDTQKKQTHALTGPYTNDYSPVWDPDGRYLYFASDRNINPLIGEMDFNNVEIRNDKLYMILLREDVENPLLARAGMPPAGEDEDEL
jgi:tricorn protease